MCAHGGTVHSYGKIHVVAWALTGSGSIIRCLMCHSCDRHVVREGNYSIYLFFIIIICRHERTTLTNKLELAVTMGVNYNS